MVKKMEQIKINKFKKVFQIFLWILVLFVITRGVFSFMRKDESKAIKASIKEMANSQDKKRLVELNAVSFAESFTRAFVEYDGDEATYKNNISKYVSSNFKVGSSVANAEVMEVIPAKSEWLGDKKILIDCIVKVKYSGKVNVSPTVKPSESASASPRATPSATQTPTPKSSMGNQANKTIELCLRIPVSVNADGFVVESNPLFVASDSKSNQTSESDDEGEKVNDEGIKDVLKSFITAYCRGDETEIGYYMLPDSTKIKGLGNNFTFKEFDKLELKKKDDRYFANATYIVENPSGSYIQGMQIIFVFKDKKYLIEKLNTVIK